MVCYVLRVCLGLCGKVYDFWCVFDGKKGCFGRNRGVMGEKKVILSDFESSLWSA